MKPLWNPYEITLKSCTTSRRFTSTPRKLRSCARHWPVSRGATRSVGTSALELGAHWIWFSDRDKSDSCVYNYAFTHTLLYIYIIKGAFTKVSVFNMFGFFQIFTHTHIYTVYVCMLYMYVIYLNRCGWCGASIAMVASLGISKVWLMDRCICKIHQAAMIGASWGLPVPNPPYNCRNVLKNSMQAGGCCESSIRSICWFCWGLLLRQIRGIGMRNSS